MADPIAALPPLPRLEPLLPGGSAPRPDAAARPSFAALLAQALDRVNQLQLDADRQAEMLAGGEGIDLHQAMIAAQKAELALQFTVQIRNRALEAYQEIIRMQV